ncbi:helix-turn-helix domain-containing protein [Chitinophaga sp. YIM B06452]|uniref:helix-turn-helix domain-containing protein n=1 Tax=Chitinophaga sp. YIM B06452 TaxID=3082158 RepID=UPI0031FEAEA8
MEAILEKPTRSDQKIARALHEKMSEASAKLAKKSTHTFKIQIDGYTTELSIPKSAVQLLFAILQNMADGNTIALLLSNSNADISTQQAADLLGVSRPHVVMLLDRGDIPHFKVGTHRRIHLKDLIEFDKKMKKNRADKLDQLAAQAQELNMGY